MSCCQKNLVCYTREDIQRAVENLGYKYFTNGHYNVNIIGIRNSETGITVTNKFDDCMTISYIDENNDWQFKRYACTTDAGKYWVENIMRKEGVAYLKEGQYLGSHKIRKHRGQYEALCQQKDMIVYRDGNKDDKYDLDENNTQEGIFGINIHRATKYAGKTSSQIDKWSAGCQVIASNDDWSEFMKIMRKARSYYGNSFTYTLINSKNI